MLRERLLLRLMKRASSAGVSCAVTTNGFWGETLRMARSKLKRLRRSGLRQLTVSYDPFHEVHLPIERICHIARAAEEQGFTLQVNLTRMLDEGNLDGIADALRAFGSVQLRFYDVQRVGRALQFDAESFRSTTKGFCNACDRAAISDDGRVMACNGPSYFSGADSPLVVGSIEENSVGELLDRHARDPILEAIRVQGPLHLKNLLDEANFRPRKSREVFTGLCDLCLHLTSDPEAVGFLRETLSTPLEEARRESLRQMIEAKRRGGEFHRSFVNGVGITRTVLEAALPGVAEDFSMQAPHLLSRSDLDWQNLLRLIRGNGLARAFVSFSEQPQVVGSAPAFFGEAIRESALRESLKLVQVEKVLRTISRILLERDLEAVLLKGAGLMAHCMSEGEKIPCKAPGDIDLHISPEHAREVWEALVDKGYSEVGIASRTHHLPALRHGGVTVEIHFRIMPEKCGLPEDELLASSVPVSGWEPFRVLSREGIILHTAVHFTHESYTHGLKSFWAMLYALSLSEDESISWSKLERWSERIAWPRAFWVPVQVACEDLGFPFPPGFVRSAPTGRRQELLLRYARNRVYQVMDHAVSGAMVHHLPHGLLLCEGMGARLRFLANELVGSGMAARLAFIRKKGWRRYLRSKMRLLGSTFRISRR